MNFSQKVSLFLVSLFGGLFLFSLSVQVSLAAPADEIVIQNPAENLTSDVSNPFGTGEKIKPDAARDGDLQTSFIGIVNYLLLFLGLLLLIIIIYAGVLIILSDGEEDAVSKGRKMIMYALIGVVIIVLSYTIVNFIADVANGGKDE